MIKESLDILTSLIIMGIPECIALTLLMLAFLQLPLIWKKIIVSGIIQAIIVLIFRIGANSFELPGIHTAAAIISLGLLVSYFWNTSRLKTLTCSIIVIITLSLIELLYYNLFEILFSESIEQIMLSKLYWAMSGWLNIITLSLFAWLITKTKWYQKRIQKYTPFNHSEAR